MLKIILSKVCKKEKLQKLDEYYNIINCELLISRIEFSIVM